MNGIKIFVVTSSEFSKGEVLGCYTTRRLAEERVEYAKEYGWKDCSISVHILHSPE